MLSQPSFGQLHSPDLYQQDGWHLQLKWIFTGVFFFAAFIMYLLSVICTPKEYRSIGYIPKEEHSPSTV